MLRQRRSLARLLHMTKRFPVPGARTKKSPVKVDWAGRVQAMRQRAGLTQKEFAAHGWRCATSWESAGSVK